MSRVVAVRAGPELDGELIRFTSSIGTGQGLQIALDRSPSFFAALEVEGEDPVVVAFVHDGRVVGTGVMTWRRVHLNGSSSVERVGQLGSARIDPAHRSGTLLARCSRLLHEWHLEQPGRVLLTTILEDNRVARATFESGRAGLPRYRDRGRLVTLSCPVGRGERGGPAPSREVRVEPARERVLADIVAFWGEQGPRRQFFPGYRLGDLGPQGGLLRGLAPEDLLVARAAGTGQILGTLGLWDQSAFRRWVVRGLPKALARCAPALDLAARLTGGLRLPRPGEPLAQRFAAGLCVVDDDVAVFGALLRAARQRLAREGGCWFTLGFHEDDPLLRRARRMRHRELHSRLYLVHWTEGAAIADAIDEQRCPYVEIGGL